MNPVSVETLIEALALPASCRVDQRVPKKMLADNGAPAAADKRLLTDGIEAVQWVAALKPGTVAVPEYRDETREYLEIVVLAVEVRDTHGKPAQVRRLAELVHRAIPYPVLLLQTLAERVLLTAGHKRAAQNEAGKVVLDGELTVAEIVGPVDALAPMLQALAMSRQSQGNLQALYQGWIDCLNAWQAAQYSGAFSLKATPEQTAAQREALRTCQRLEAEVARLHALAAKEKQMARQVELNLALKRLNAELASARGQL